MYKKFQENAAYDIQLGDVDLIDVFSFLSPSSDTFYSAYGQSVKDLGIQRQFRQLNDMMSFLLTTRAELLDKINDAVHINAKNVGLVFRQTMHYMNTVSLADVYGTLAFEDSPLSLNLGSSLKLPLNDLPSLSLHLANMAGGKDQKVDQICPDVTHRR